MNTIKRIFGMLAVILAVIFMDACKAEKGDIGPAGAAGANGTNGAIGATGAAGIAGATGATGATGTANVIYSDWISVTFTGSGTNWSGKMTAPKITQDILDKGVVKAYFKLGSSIYEGNYVNIPNAVSLSYHSTLGFVNMVSSFNATTVGNSYLWRYVIIPGGVGARKAAVDYSDYEAVKKYYNLPD